MFSRFLTTAAAAAFLLGAVAAPTYVRAEMVKKEETKKDETKKAAKKELTPQQQKMKDCAAKWKDEKKAKNVSGRKAYNEFMSKCLKG